ncbi:uncharacterized protein MONOS_16213 [Monocercomonoides exilis]|uniref:uncharacterized protein n=1 Tax=Monocercomonoides exilis TaxID=2049356 RepID=UPI00355AAE92|nr:hypothetical protein MONOS_16213 [Monocercomonoides exilis]|eukprot:MONOS_16213.1-p1 / transcript=MONOS_16213.1 / gene=MONOS_16213 / organism=Monocercomonoides_exilis_PA203 / gene_product=unspecified product / transcript_product=unspecified product / location=Mono_scaffold01569:2348-4013(-) / protein_length=446 / sequence_SO=supercontig / SO=protein_coding / is_pseudo=false
MELSSPLVVRFSPLIDEPPKIYSKYQHVFKCFCGKDDDWKGGSVQCNRCYCCRHVACLKALNISSSEPYYCEFCSAKFIDCPCKKNWACNNDEIIFIPPKRRWVHFACSQQYDLIENWFELCGTAVEESLKEFVEEQIREEEERMEMSKEDNIHTISLRRSEMTSVKTTASEAFDKDRKRKGEKARKKGERVKEKEDKEDKEEKEINTKVRMKGKEEEEEMRKENEEKRDSNIKEKGKSDKRMEESEDRTESAEMIETTSEQSKKHKKIRIRIIVKKHKKQVIPKEIEKEEKKESEDKNEMGERVEDEEEKKAIEGNEREKGKEKKKLVKRAKKIKDILEKKRRKISKNYEISGEQLKKYRKNLKFHRKPSKNTRINSKKEHSDMTQKERETEGSNIKSETESEFEEEEELQLGILSTTPSETSADDVNTDTWANSVEGKICYTF